MNKTIMFRIVKGSIQMKVLQDRILVAIQSRADESDLVDRAIRKGRVAVSGSKQIKLDDEVLFGEDYEEIEVEGLPKATYYLMHEQNVKIIYDSEPTDPQENVLPFVKQPERIANV